MAKAKDEGVDVIDVLMYEYREALVRKGYRRREIDDLCARANGLLDEERESPRGVDIVDMIMDDAVARVSHRRLAAARSTYYRSYVGPASRVYMRKNMSAARDVPHFLVGQAVELRRAKANLVRLYSLEQNAMAAAWRRPAQDLYGISKRRASAERRYVGALIRYLRDSNQMGRARATDVQRYFTRQSMTGMGPVNKGYLLGMFAGCLPIAAFVNQT